MMKTVKVPQPLANSEVQPQLYIYIHSYIEQQHICDNVKLIGRMDNDAMSINTVTT